MGLDAAILVERDRGAVTFVVNHHFLGIQVLLVMAALAHATLVHLLHCRDAVISHFDSAINERCLKILQQKDLLWLLLLHQKVSIQDQELRSGLNYGWLIIGEHFLLF